MREQKSFAGTRQRLRGDIQEELKLETGTTDEDLGLDGVDRDRGFH